MYVHCRDIPGGNKNEIFDAETGEKIPYVVWADSCRGEYGQKRLDETGQPIVYYDKSGKCARCNTIVEVVDKKWRQICENCGGPVGSAHTVVDVKQGRIKIIHPAAGDDGIVEFVKPLTINLKT